MIPQLKIGSSDEGEAREEDPRGPRGGHRRPQARCQIKKAEEGGNKGISGEKMHSKRVGDWGEKVFAEKLMEELRLRPIMTRALDKAGTDKLFTFGLLMDGFDEEGDPVYVGKGEIHVQIKTSCLREYPDGQRYWKFRIIRKTKELDEELWSRSDFFLGLVLAWCHPDEFTGDEPPPGTKRKELMMPGKDVVEFFRKHKTAKHIRLYQKKFERGGYEFLEGADDLYAIFSDQMDDQTEEALETVRELFDLDDDPRAYDKWDVG